jgi:lambda family phage tail tape measure protein
MAERNLSIRLSVVDGGKVKAELSEIGEKGERSLKKIEAAATPASGGLKLLSNAANDAKFQLQAATDRLGMLGSVLGKLGPAGLIAGAGLAAVGVGITALVLPVANTADELANLAQKTGISVKALSALTYVAQMAKFFDEQRRTVRVMGQKFVLDTEAQAKEVQAIYDKFLPTLPRKPKVALDLSSFQKPKPAEKLNEGEAFLNQLRSSLTRTQEGEAAELRARALQIEAKGYKGVATEAEQYIQVLEAIERQKEANKAFDAFEKEEVASRKITEGLIGGNRQRIEALQLQRQMLDMSDAEKVALQARSDLEKAAANARKEASQIEDPGLRAQTIEAINDALARQLPIVEELVRTNADYQRSFEYGAKSALRTYIDDATNAAKRAQQVTANAFRGMETALTQFVMTGKLDFKSLADSIIADLLRIQIQRSITLPLANAMSSMDWGSMWGSLFPSAQGNVFNAPALSAYRNTVVDRPTLFPFAQGAGFTSLPRIGLMGEKPGSPGEAIMPLTRMRDGDLGVKVNGGGSTVIVNVIEAAGKGGQQQQRTDSNGNQVIDVWVEQITAKVWGDVARGAGPGPGVLANTYGLNRVAGAC